ncbi:MAG: class I SAM-dependent methyltransferase [Pyrinomonadaceae bacterium]
MISVKRLRRLFVYTPPDPVSFWRPRATDPGWLAVMWANATYNELAHRDQWNAIDRNLPTRRDAVLDLGCGIGRLSAPLAGRFENYVGVDLDTMVNEARRRHPDLAEKFVTASVQDYDYPVESFDLVLSMACLASACSAEELPEIAKRIVNATRPGGRIILIDPFHRLPALTRTCRLSARQVIAHFTGLGMIVAEWSGVHFFPGRLLLARPWLSKFTRLTRIGYRIGEAVGRLAPRLLSDYSVIALTKK